MFCNCDLNFVTVVYANDVSAYIPELWANESLAILQENLVAANLVHRDFSDQVAAFGETVNTRRPAKFNAIRKGANDDVTDQDATATNVAVVLNQLPHVAFVLRDADVSKSFKDLVVEFLDPAVKAMAKQVDQIVLGQAPQFLANAVGGLGSISSSNVKDRILAARNRQNVNLAPEEGRNFIWTPNAETEALKLDLFMAANTVGDNGNALANAALGRKYGYDHYMSQLAPSVPVTACDVVTGAVNNASGEPFGDTSLIVDGFSAAIAAGTWITIDGQPYRVSGTTGGAAPTVITIPAPGLRAAVANDAVILVIDPGAVNFGSGYDAGHYSSIAFNGTTNLPAVGQMVSFGTSPTSAVYTIIGATSTTITLDRPLEAALANGDAVNFGPYGEFNFAFNRNALSLVTRPLALPMGGLVAQGAVVSYGGLSMRVTITYDGRAQGTRVTIDMLMGVKVLDVAQGCVILG